MSDRLRDYVTVAERLSAAAEQIESITTGEPVLIGPDGMGYIRAVVRLKDGRAASGTASFILGLDGRSAQATNPLEDAETSAVGRALAFLGYETKRGVASREEVNEAQRRADRRREPTRADVRPVNVPKKGDEVIGVVSEVRATRKDNDTVTLSFVLDGVRYIAGRLDASYLDAQSGEVARLRVGNTADNGALFADIIEWQVAA